MGAWADAGVLAVIVAAGFTMPAWADDPTPNPFRVMFEDACVHQHQSAFVRMPTRVGGVRGGPLGLVESVPSFFIGAVVARDWEFGVLWALQPDHLW